MSVPACPLRPALARAVQVAAGLLLLAALAAAAPVVEVVRVIDGDSFVARVGSRRVEVRVRGIDCPEWRQPFGPPARDAAMARLGHGGSGIRIEARARDVYGRTVADVALPGGLDLATELVRAGFAWADPRLPATHSLRRAEAEARRASRGLWKGSRPEPPWEFRRRR